MARPIQHNGFFGVVAVAKNQIQLVDALLNPPLKQPQIKPPLKSRAGVVVVDFWKVNVGYVFFGFV